MKYTIEQLCLFTGYTYNELNKRTRNQTKVYARYVIIDYLLKHKHTHKDAAGYFGLNHSTCDHALKSLNNPFNHIAVNAIRVFNINMKEYKELNKAINEQEAFIYESLIN